MNTKANQAHGNPQGRAQAKPEVLAQYNDEQLARMERRAQDISDEELRHLERIGDQAFERVRTIGQLIGHLQAARKRRGLTLAQVDEQSGIGRSNLSRLENLHLANPTIDTILRYAQAVGVELRVSVTDPKGIVEKGAA